LNRNGTRHDDDDGKLATKTMMTSINTIVPGMRIGNWEVLSVEPTQKQFRRRSAIGKGKAGTGIEHTKRSRLKKLRISQLVSCRLFSLLSVAFST
jgi:hypothetical protein